MVSEYIPIVASAVFSLVFGFIYFHPKVAGGIWMKESGVKMGGDKKKGMGKGIVMEFIGALVLAYVLNLFIGFAGATTVSAAAMIGVWAWLGFVATTTLGSVAWEGKSPKLFVVKNLYSLIQFAVVGAILVSL